MLLYCYQNGSLKVFPGRVSLLLNALELTEKMFPPRVSPRRLVLLYYFVYCKSFNVLSRFSERPVFGAKSSAKLRRISELTKFFINFFQKNFHRLFRRPVSPEKRVQSYDFFTLPPNFFREIFREIFATFALLPDLQIISQLKNMF